VGGPLGGPLQGTLRLLWRIVCRLSGPARSGLLQCCASTGRRGVRRLARSGAPTSSRRRLVPLLWSRGIGRAPLEPSTLVADLDPSLNKAGVSNAT
jgi:hypothetical protein